MRKIGHKCFVGLLIACLSFSLVWAPVANAQAGIAAGRLSVAISELTIAKAARWGFAANDPRVTATRAGISGGLTVLATGAGVVSWPALLVAAGIVTVAAGAIALAKDGKFTWLFGTSGNVTAGGTTAGGYMIAGRAAGITPTGGGELTATGKTYVGTAARWDSTKNMTVYDVIAGSSPEIVAAMVVADSYWVQDGLCSTPGGGAGTPSVNCPFSHGSSNKTVSLSYYATGAGYSSSSGTYDGRPPPPDVVITPVIFTKPDDAVAQIPAAVSAAIMSPELLAATANTAWKAATPASTSGGIPWSASDPITPADVSVWMSANPSMVPTVSNFTQASTVTVDGKATVPVGGAYSFGGGQSASLPSSGGSSSTPTTGTAVPAPTTGTGNTPTTNPTNVPATAPATNADPNATQINLGPIPNIGMPTLEDTPGSASILDPIFALMPDLKSFAVPSHSGVCPTAAFALYGKSYVMDAHCGLLEQNRELIGALMVIVFTLAATYTVLRA